MCGLNRSTSRSTRSKFLVRAESRHGEVIETSKLGRPAVTAASAPPMRAPARPRPVAARPSCRGGCFQLLDGDLLTLRLDVHHLAAHHADGPGRFRHLGDHLGHLSRPHRAARRLRASWNASVSSASPARIARASPNTLCAVRPAAPEVVVVHRRQVVVDQRVGVDHLERARGGIDRARRAPTTSAPREAQDRPQPLAAGQDAVAHRAMHGRGRRSSLGRNRSSAASTSRRLSFR